MSIYGGKRKYVGAKRLRMNLATLNVTERAEIIKTGVQAKKPKRWVRQSSNRGYDYEYTRLYETESALRFNLRSKVSRLISTAKKNNSSPPVIVGWGCGAGVTERELADSVQGNARIFGFGDLAYNEWETPSPVRLIHGVEEDFFCYFKKDSIDIIYSHHGLYNTQERRYIPKILSRLKVWGELVTITKDPQSWLPALMASKRFVDRPMFSPSVVERKGKCKISGIPCIATVTFSKHIIVKLKRLA